MRLSVYPLISQACIHPNLILKEKCINSTQLLLISNIFHDHMCLKLNLPYMVNVNVQLSDPQNVGFDIITVAFALVLSPHTTSTPRGSTLSCR